MYICTWCIYWCLRVFCEPKSPKVRFDDSPHLRKHPQLPMLPESINFLQDEMFCNSQGWGPHVSKNPTKTKKINSSMWGQSNYSIQWICSKTRKSFRIATQRTNLKQHKRLTSIIPPFLLPVFFSTKCCCLDVEVETKSSIDSVEDEATSPPTRCKASSKPSYPKAAEWIDSSLEARKRRNNFGIPGFWIPIPNHQFSSGGAKQNVLI